MDVSTALKVLRAATADTLRNHQQEIKLTLADVGQRLKAVPSLNHQIECESLGSEYSASISDGSDPSSYNEVSEAESSVESRQGTPLSNRLHESLEGGVSPGNCNPRNPGFCQGSVSNANTPLKKEDVPIKLLASSIVGLHWLLEFSQKEPAGVIYSKRNERKDRRIEDIQRVEGKRRPNNVEKIFRGFAQRSMGLQLTRLQSAAKVKTRVDELCESINSSDPQVRARIQRRSGFIAKNLHHFRFPREDRDIVLRGINAGVKQLVLEELLGRRLEEAGRPSRPAAISSVAALNISAFSRLHFEEIPRFIDLLFLESSKVEIPVDSSIARSDSSDAFFQIPDALVNLSQWSADFQVVYEEDTNFADKPGLEPQSRSFSGQRTPAQAAVNEMTTITDSHSFERPPKRPRLNVSSTASSNSQLHPGHNTTGMQYARFDPMPDCNDNIDHENAIGLSNYDAAAAATSGYDMASNGYCNVTQVVHGFTPLGGFNDINQVIEDDLNLDACYWPTQTNIRPLSNGGFEVTDPVLEQNDGFYDVTHAVQNYSHLDAFPIA